MVLSQNSPRPTRRFSDQSYLTKHQLSTLTYFLNFRLKNTVDLGQVFSDMFLKIIFNEGVFLCAAECIFSKIVRINKFTEI